MMLMNGFWMSGFVTIISAELPRNSVKTLYFITDDSFFKIDHYYVFFYSQTFLLFDWLACKNWSTKISQCLESNRK